MVTAAAGWRWGTADQGGRTSRGHLGAFHWLVAGSLAAARKGSLGGPNDPYLEEQGRNRGEVGGGSVG